jgi:predicted nucleotidyltransferase
MVVPITAAQLNRYRLTVQHKQAERQQRNRLRQREGWRVAQQATHILKRDFAVKRVYLFGSIPDIRRIRSESDIDLAVEGLADPAYLEAVAQLLDLSDFAIDLGLKLSPQIRLKD